MTEFNFEPRSRILYEEIMDGEFIVIHQTDDTEIEEIEGEFESDEIIASITMTRETALKMARKIIEELGDNGQAD